MSKSNMPRLNVLFFLQIFLAIYFIISGIQGIQGYNSTANEFIRNLSKTFGGSNNKDLFTIVIAVIKLVAGGILGLSLFLPFKRSFKTFGNIIAFALQAFLIGYNNFYMSISSTNGSVTFSPNIMGWLLLLSIEAIILLSIWAVRTNFD